MQIEATEEQVKYARDYVNKGSIGNRKDFDGDENKQFFGILAECIISDLLGVSRPINKADGVWDGGYDISIDGLKWDVKCEIRNVPFKPRLFVHNLSGHQVNYPSDGLIFVSYNCEKAIFEICGYIKKADFIHFSEYFPEGTQRTRSDGSTMTVNGARGMYELQQKYLKSFATFINNAASTKDPK